MRGSDDVINALAELDEEFPAAKVLMDEFDVREYVDAGGSLGAALTRIAKIGSPVLKGRWMKPSP